MITYTAKQLEVMKIISAHIRAKGIAPTYSEIAAKLGVSSITVFEHCDALKKKGAIVMQKGVQRSIQIQDEAFKGQSERDVMYDRAILAICALLKTNTCEVEKRLRDGTEFCACESCGKLTDSTGTKRCDTCWEKEKAQKAAALPESWEDIPAPTAPALATA